MEVTWDSITHPKERKENSLEAQRSSITKFRERKQLWLWQMLDSVEVVISQG